jgi:hypothetical protein
MPHFRLSRRAMLRGAGGACVGLPFLEIMMPRLAMAAVPPKRFLVTFGGISCGGGTGESTALPNVVPKTTGQGFALPTGLAPLGTYGLASDVTFVSGLKIGWSGETASRPVAWHPNSLCPLFAGSTPSGTGGSCNKPTSDQLIIPTVGMGSRFGSVVLRVQPDPYRDGLSSKGRMSYAASNGSAVQPIEPIYSPRLAYTSLFSNFVPPAGSTSTMTGPDPAMVRAQLRQKSVLDLVADSSDKLSTRLGSADRQRLQLHFDEIRALENRLSAVDPVDAGTTMMGTPSQCALPMQPMADPATTISTDPGNDDADVGYSKELERGRLMSDLLHMAFTCDLTRSASLMYTWAQSFMNVSLVINRTTDAHEAGHASGTQAEHAKVLAWHVDQWAYLINKMKATPEAGGTLLDNSVAMFLTEGGWGQDPEGGSSGSPHSSVNMVVLMAGRAGGGLTPKGHVVATGSHPAQVTLSAMRGLGYTGAFNEITNGITGI